MLLLCLGAALALVTLARPPYRSRRVNLEDVTAILREHVDPGLEAVDLARGTVGNSQETWFVDARRRAASPSSSSSAAPPRPASSPGPTASRSTRCSAPSRVTACPSRRCSRSASTSARSSSWNDFPAPRPGRLYAGRATGRSGGRSAPCSPGSMRSTPPSSASTPPARPRRGRCAQVRQYQRLYESARPAPVPLLGALLAWAERNCPPDEVRAAVALGRPGRAQPPRRRRACQRAARLGADAHRRPARRPRRGGLELPRIVRPRRHRGRLRGGRRRGRPAAALATSSRSRARRGR